MARFYKLFTKPRTVFCVICFILITAFSHQSAEAANNAVFTVQDIKVDVTSDSASISREQAFAKAQYRAFKQLVDRLLSEDQLEFFVMPAPSVISALVKDFEITEEQLSNVRYIGTYIFRFENDAVRNYLGGQGFAYTDVSSKPVLILPFYQQGARTLLWGIENPWLAAWSSAQSSQGLVPVIIPIGDIQDVSDIGDNESLNWSPEKLNDLTQRYAAGESIIMLATPEWNNGTIAAEGSPPDRLTIMVYRTSRGTPEFTSRVHITAEDIALHENIFSAGVRQSRKNLQTAWKRQTLVNAAQGNNLKVRVKFETIKEWVETQKKLRRVQGVGDMKLLSLKQNEANLELTFRGSEHRLRLALAQADMTLSTPRINFGNQYQNRQNPYDDVQQRLSPLVYDLYLNKYKRY